MAEEGPELIRKQDCQFVKNLLNKPFDPQQYDLLMLDLETKAKEMRSLAEEEGKRVHKKAKTHADARDVLIRERGACAEAIGRAMEAKLKADQFTTMAATYQGHFQGSAAAASIEESEAHAALAAAQLAYEQALTANNEKALATRNAQLNLDLAQELVNDIEKRLEVFKLLARLTELLVTGNCVMLMPMPMPTPAAMVFVSDPHRRGTIIDATYNQQMPFIFKSGKAHLERFMLENEHFQDRSLCRRMKDFHQSGLWRLQVFSNLLDWVNRPHNPALLFYHIQREHDYIDACFKLLRYHTEYCNAQRGFCHVSP